MTMERVTPAMTPLAAAIHAAAFPPSEAWSAQVIGLQVEVPGCFGFIDENGGLVLARTMADEAEIITLAVHPAARRLGLGAALMDAAMCHATAAGARAMFLEVAEHNDAARRLYLRLGFAEVGRRKRYYANGDDALVMRRALTAPDAAPAR